MADSDTKTGPLLGSDLSEEERDALREKYSTKGWAPIKPEFIIVHRTEKRKEDETLGGAPAAKRPKLKGQNKRRPGPSRGKGSSGPRLCPHVVAANEEACPFGKDCRLSHDLAAFAAQRPADLEPQCPVFLARGRCDLGVTCRFGASHTDAEGRNLVAEEKWSAHKPSKNVLSVELQRTLRKRAFDFNRSFKTLDALGIPVDPRQRAGAIKAHAAAGDNAKPGVDGAVDLSTLKHGGDSKAPPAAEADAAQTEASAAVARVEEAGGALAAPAHMTSAVPALAPEPEAAVDLSSPQGEPEAAVDLSSPLAEAEAEQRPERTAAAAHFEVTVNGEQGSPPPAHMDHGADDSRVVLRSVEKRKVDFTNKTYLAPLTTVGNLPFRRVCKEMGADITCGEMAMASNLLQAKKSEWALLRRHPSEDVFGVQLCGSFPDLMTKCAQLVNEQCEVDFVDVNCGCPIDMVYHRGEGVGLMRHQRRLESIARGMSSVLDCPLTVKMRTGIQDGKNTAHILLPRLHQCGVAMVTIHGRTREQRYTRQADWKYIGECVTAASPMPVFGNGDVLSWEDAVACQEASGVAGTMLARGALVKPWLFTEIRERRHWDISAPERLDIVRKFSHFGLEHWGSDEHGVETTRRFLLEWLSFLHRYIPVGLLERLPQRINEKPPQFVGRSDLETLLSSSAASDWVKISEMFLGPVPENFIFLPKHKANSYST